MTAQPDDVAGIVRVVRSPDVAENEIEFRDENGKLVGKIVDVGTPEERTIDLRGEDDKET